MEDLRTKAIKIEPTPTRNTVHDALCNMLNISEKSTDDEIMKASEDFKEKFYNGKNIYDEGGGTDKQPDQAVK